MDEKNKKTLKKGDLVKMINCIEGEHHDRIGNNIWECRDDSFWQGKGKLAYEIVFIKNFSGFFLCEKLSRL